MMQNPLVRFAKAFANLIALLIVSLPALTCWVENRLNAGGEGVFAFWTHAVAFLPGLPGLYIRRAFYYLTLQHCSLNCSVGFGVLFSHRQASVEGDVHIGPYAVVGSAHLAQGSLIGTRASLLSGSAQHELGPDGRWEPSDSTRLRKIQVGPHAWIGEAATVMADVGPGALVAAGSVVSTAVPSGILVAGNPARFVRQLQSVEPAATRPEAELPSATARYFGFIDWLKCLGMLLIVYGHTAGWAPFASLPPIYSKQLGVAFFLFIVGFSLSHQSTDRWHVAFNRLFEVWLFGLALALFMSVVKYTTLGTIQKSNYAPLLGGMNVFFNFFPANPTTWYLGTYIHVVILWALAAYRIRVSLAILAGVFVAEIVVRALLMQTAGRMIAYMAFPNWSTVLLLGTWYGQRNREKLKLLPDYAALGAGLALVAGVIVWTALAARLPFEGTFPFMDFRERTTAEWILLTSAMVSTAYALVTWLAFNAVAPLTVPWPVRFVARNTLIIFLGHMPVVYALLPVLQAAGVGRGVSSMILMIVCVPGLGLLSETIHRVIDTRRWRDQVWARLKGESASPRAVSSPSL